METTQAALPSRRLDWSDGALLAAYLLQASLGCWQQCLMVNDGAVYITAAWLGDAWSLFFDQNQARALSTFFQFGPIWLLRPLFGGAAHAFSIAAHVLYFAGPLILYLVLRAIERRPLFSRLYLCVVLSMIYFTSEMIAGIGLWLIWLANADRSGKVRVVPTVLFAAALAFTHPALALVNLLLAMAGGLLIVCGRPFPRPIAGAALAMGILLLLAYIVLSTVFHASNPTVALQQGLNKYDYINPLWMLATLVLFPMLIALWLLLLLPGAVAIGAPSRWTPITLAVAGAVGLWFAAAGTGLLTWLYARHTAGHVLAVAIALALVAPAAWVAAAARPLTLYAAISAVAALSYNADLFLFGRFVDRAERPGILDVDSTPGLWPPPLSGAYGMRGYFKWGAGADYQRDVVVPIYDWYRVTLAFYSYFRSDRASVVFHEVGKRGEWVPFECGPLERVRGRPHDARDEIFLSFLADHYCVP